MGNNEMLELPFDEEIEEAEPIYRTYRMDFEKKRIVGMTNGLEAACQSIFKALQTRRFAYLIYDDQYGCDIFNKIGNLSLTQGYLENDIPSMILDTFANDEMIQNLGTPKFEILDEDNIRIEFHAFTVFGDAEIEGVIIDA